MDDQFYIDRAKLEALQGCKMEKDFAKDLGISRAYLHGLKTHRFKAGGKFIRGLTAAFPKADIRAMLVNR